MVILVPVRLLVLVCVAVAVKSSDEGLTLETSANTLFTAFSVSTSTFKYVDTLYAFFYIVGLRWGSSFRNLNYSRLYSIAEHPKSHTDPHKKKVQ